MSGSLACPEQTIREYTGLANHIARGYFAPGLDHADLLQEALIGLCKAARDYQPGGASFQNFAWQCMERQVITAVKSARRGKHELLNTAVGLSTPLSEDGGTLEDRLPGPADDDPAVRVLQLETFRRQRDIVLRATHGERAALAKWLSGDGYADDKSTDNALQRIRSRLRAAA